MKDFTSCPVRPPIAERSVRRADRANRVSTNVESVGQYIKDYCRESQRKPGDFFECDRDSGRPTDRETGRLVQCSEAYSNPRASSRFRISPDRCEREHAANPYPPQPRLRPPPAEWQHPAAL